VNGRRQKLGLGRHLSSRVVDRGVLWSSTQRGRPFHSSRALKGSHPILKPSRRYAVIASSAGSCEEVAEAPRWLSMSLIRQRRAGRHPLSYRSAYRRVSRSRSQASRRMLVEQGSGSDAKLFERNTLPAILQHSGFGLRNTPCRIVTPAYNMGRFIRHTIDSVLSQ